MKKNAGGRPLKYKTKEELQKAIDIYFAECDSNKEPYTVTGLALALNMSRQDLINYQDRKMFFDTIKNAKLKIENYLEKHLVTDNGVTGIIFNLKNNYGWKDKQETINVNTNYEDYIKQVEDKDEY